jgi:hypothetical protein
MTRYRVSEPVHLETHHDTHGSIELTFEGGEYVPRSEQEEAALVHLTTIGFAEAVAEVRAAEPSLPPAEPEVTHAPE